jgi:hypothetical protein
MHARPSIRLLAALLLLPPLGPTAAPGQEAAPRPAIQGTVQKPYTLNSPIAELRLPDLAGKEHVLAGPKDERVLVLVFWSLRDGPSRFYVPELTRLAKAHGDRLALYLVDSNVDELVGGNADPLDRVRKWFRDEQVKLTLLLDRDNVVADDFKAVANGQVFLVDGNHVLRYQGGIDDDPAGTRAAAGQPVTSWLEPALTSVLAGGLPEVPLTRPAGRPIKRAKKKDR